MTQFILTHGDGITAKISLSNLPWIKRKNFENEEFTAYTAFDNEPPIYKILIRKGDDQEEWQEVNKEEYDFTASLFPDNYGYTHRIQIGAREGFAERFRLKEARLRLLRMIVPGREICNYKDPENPARDNGQEYFYIANIMKWKGGAHRRIFDLSPLLRSWSATQEDKYDDFPAFLQLKYNIEEREDSCVLAYSLVKGAYLNEWHLVEQLVAKASDKGSESFLAFLYAKAEIVASQKVYEGARTL